MMYPSSASQTRSEPHRPMILLPPHKRQPRQQILSRENFPTFAVHPPNSPYPLHRGHLIHPDHRTISSLDLNDTDPRQNGSLVVAPSRINRTIWDWLDGMIQAGCPPFGLQKQVPLGWYPRQPGVDDGEMGAIMEFGRSWGYEGQ